LQNDHPINSNAQTLKKCLNHKFISKIARDELQILLPL